MKTQQNFALGHKKISNGFSNVKSTETSFLKHATQEKLIPWPF